MTDPKFLSRLSPEISERAERGTAQMRGAEAELVRKMNANGLAVEDIFQASLRDEQIRFIIEFTAVADYDALRSKLAGIVVERGWCDRYFTESLAAAVQADRRGDNAVASTLAGGLVAATVGKRGDVERLGKLKMVAHELAGSVLARAVANELAASKTS